VLCGARSPDPDTELCKHTCAASIYELDDAHLIISLHYKRVGTQRRLPLPRLRAMLIIIIAEMLGVSTRIVVNIWLIYSSYKVI